MTPRETWQVINAYEQRSDIDRRLLMWQTWHIAAFIRAKRMPAYHELLPQKTKRVSKSEKERMRAEFEQLRGKFEGKWQKQQH